MPYIEDTWDEIIQKGRREELNPTLREVLPDTDGEVNYCITKIVWDYLTRKGKPRYSDYNAAIGIFECAKLELYRRKVAEYEDIKIKENGDVY